MSSIDEASEQDPEDIYVVGDHISYTIGDDDFATGIIKGFSPEGCPVVIDDDNVRLILKENR